MALVAQQEREGIWRRTREALAAQGARRAGNPNGAAALRRAGRGGAPLREAIARNADRHAEDFREVVEDIRAGGATSLRTMAAELNGRGILTRRGGRWHVSTVMNLLNRLAAASAGGVTVRIEPIAVAPTAGLLALAAQTRRRKPLDG